MNGFICPTAEWTLVVELPAWPNFVREGVEGEVCFGGQARDPSPDLEKTGPSPGSS